MAKLQWDSKYSVNVASIDDQHKELIKLMLNLWNAIESGQGRQTIGKVITGLFEYTRTHFVHEENLMKQLKYEDHFAHQVDHERFIAELNKAATDLMEGRAVPSVKVLKMMAQWLLDHILVHDKKLGAFLSEKGVK